MKLGIMQPYFFPYLGYFELIARTDCWVVFDVVQYNRRSWMNRNRILHPTRGWQYITVPVVKAPLGAPICEIRVDNRAAALRRTLGQLDHYRKRAPHFDRVTELVRSAFDITSDRLVDLNVSALTVVCGYLGIDFRHLLYSTASFEPDEIEHAGQWALRIATQLGASAYLNPPGGRKLFRPAEWDAAGIGLQFTDFNDFRYDCRPYDFIENLSILDVLMWSDAATVAQALRRRA